MTESTAFQPRFKTNRPWASPWQYKLDVSDLFHDEDLSFEQRRDGVVGRLRAAPFYEDDPIRWNADTEELYLVVDELADTDDEDYFDSVWNALYDWCDVDKRVWLNTWPGLMK